MSNIFKDNKGNSISDKIMERNTKCFIKALGYTINKGYGIIVEEEKELYIVNRFNNMIGCTSIDNLQMNDVDREKIKAGIIIKLDEVNTDE